MSLRTGYLFENVLSGANEAPNEAPNKPDEEEVRRRQLHGQNWYNLTYSKRCNDTFRLVNFTGSCIFTSSFFALMYPNAYSPVIRRWLEAQEQLYIDDQHSPGWVLYQALSLTFESFVNPQSVEPAFCLTQVLIDDVVNMITSSETQVEEMKRSPIEPFRSFAYLWPDIMCIQERQHMEGVIENFTFTLTNSHIDKDILFVYLRNEKSNQYVKNATSQGEEIFTSLTKYRPFYKIKSNANTYVLRSACVSLNNAYLGHMVALASCTDAHADIDKTTWLFHDGGNGLYLRDLGVFKGMPESILGIPDLFTLQYNGMSVNVWDAASSVLIFVKQ